MSFGGSSRLGCRQLNVHFQQDWALCQGWFPEHEPEPGTCCLTQLAKRRALGLGLAATTPDPCRTGWA